MKNLEQLPKTPEDFIKAYNELCKRYGFSLQAQLGWKQQIDQTFTIQVQLAIIKNDGVLPT